LRRDDGSGDAFLNISDKQDMMSKSQKQLWNPRNNNSNGTSPNDGDACADNRGHNSKTYAEEEAEFFRVRKSRFCTQDIVECIHESPPHRSLEEIINSALVVGQEVSLTVILLAVHREIVAFEDRNNTEKKPNQAQNALEYIAEKSFIAMMLVYVSMLIIVFYNQKSMVVDNSNDEDDGNKKGEASHNKNQHHKKHHRRRKAIVRLSDGILLAVMLRIISGLLRSLTASYSTDTVYALTITFLVVHLLACDYKYANGFDNEAIDDYPALLAHHPRPKFLGGTVSLSAAFFATVLLVSRIKSNATSYAVVSSVVTLFAFYPTSRHQIARNFPNALWTSPCFAITATLTTSAWLFLDSQIEKFTFVGLQMFLLVLSPCLQYKLQSYKRIISGKWDIAHITT
jgi:phosphatidylinositol glycan class C protein